MNFQAADCGEYFVARTGYTGEDGFEVMLPKEKVEAFWYDLNKVGVKPIGLGARDTLRLEAGMNLYGQDMDETVGPLESGLAWTVDLKSERDFIGKVALLANPPSKKLVGLVLLDRGVLRGHQKINQHTAKARSPAAVSLPHWKSPSRWRAYRMVYRSAIPCKSRFVKNC